MERGERWRDVWNNRDDDRADWNGMEACFDRDQDYEDFLDHIASILEEHLQFGRDDTVLDLGCGTGRLASKVAPLVEKVVAIDYSEKVLDIATRRRGLANVEYRQGDLNVLDISAYGATKAYCMSTFLYLDSPAVAYRVLDSLHATVTRFAILDIPDALVVDDRPRHYDADSFTHLRMNADEIVDRFPDLVVRRGEFPEYLNGSSRFNVYCPAA